MIDMDVISNIQKIDINSSEYPYKLKEISSPPKQLYCVGDISLLNEDAVAVVGSRKYTLYGKTVAMMIGRRLGECGVPVISGLAYGLDAFAHQGALEAEGRIIGVLGSGIKRMGPKKNYDLMIKGLNAGGLIVSEYEPDMDGQPFTYPARNRIISGLSRSLVVVEANLKSGSLITAQFASEQGRQVYAVPGNINSQFSIGSNLLIRDGAYPLIVIDDLVRAIGRTPAEPGGGRVKLGRDEKRIYEAVAGYNGVTPDDIANCLGKSTSEINSIVTIMEIKGIFQTYAGKIYLAK